MRTVGLIGGSKGHGPRRLFEWLRAAFPVRFEERPGHRLDALDGVIWLGVAPKEKVRKQNVEVPSLDIVEGDEGTGWGARSTVEFSRSARVPDVFRGISVEQEVMKPMCPVPLADGDEVLASVNGVPVWTRCKEAPSTTTRMGLSLPSLEDAGSLIDYFNRRNFFRLLPLIEFLREVTVETEWKAAGVRACFMFDDPNLHRMGYGWLNYRDVVRHATDNNYHVAFATIPLDGWAVNRGAAELFLKRPDRLSLLMHGNNHTRGELARFASEEACLAPLAQALRRVEKIEHRSALKICRVMAAPQGACSEHALCAMARLGYDAACISHGSLRAHNREKEWIHGLGIQPSEIIGGLPVIPRFPLRPESKNTILLAVYLKQPVVLVGHHQDLAAGWDLMDGLAGFINGNGYTRWMSMTEILRSNYLTRVEDDRVRIRPFSRRIHVRVAERIKEISIERPWLHDNRGEGLLVEAPAEAHKVLYSYCGGSIPVRSGSSLTITSIHPARINPNSLPDPGTDLWAVARRQLTEGRDRLQPIAGGLLRFWKRRN